MPQREDKPWYHQGLRFECTQCGDCCTGEPGYVWVTNAEIAALADVVGAPDRDAFENAYVHRVGVRKSLRELANGDCVLLDGKTRRCTVYSARPRQCRTWPFWGSNLRSPKTWQETCDICPGSGRGELYQLDEIESQRNAIRV